MGLDLSAVMLDGNHIEKALDIIRAFGGNVEDAITEFEWSPQTNYSAQGHYEVHLRGS